jgi:hypothetical protein
MKDVIKGHLQDNRAAVRQKEAITGVSTGFKELMN